LKLVLKADLIYLTKLVNARERGSDLLRRSKWARGTMSDGENDRDIDKF
jgi:hypothetical protein